MCLDHHLPSATAAVADAVTASASAVASSSSVISSSSLIRTQRPGPFSLRHMPLQWNFYALAIPGALSAIVLFFLPKTLVFNKSFLQPVPGAAEIAAEEPGG